MCPKEERYMHVVIMITRTHFLAGLDERIIKFILAIVIQCRKRH
jgi:hypothetical protein